MDIITPSISIRGTTAPAQAIITALCDFGTLEEPREPTDAEKWAAIKRVRVELLAACDWTQALDAPLTIAERAAWADYRQALRDIPQDYALAEDAVIPPAPGASA